MQSHPPTNLLQPSRPTTATHSSDTAAFGLPGYAAASSSKSPTVPSTLPNVAPRQLLAVLPTFSKFAPLRGTVRIKVENTAFYCHREVLALASPFFAGVLAGGWRETEPVPLRRERAQTETPARETRSDSFMAAASQDYEAHEPLPFPGGEGEEEGEPSTPVFDLPGHRLSISNASLRGAEAPSVSVSLAASSVVEDLEDEDDGEDFLECRLRLVEENASSFQDLLCHIYPRLECAIDWTNVEDLSRMALKFDVPSLSNACLAFLLPSAAGRPVLCMKIAEENGIPELYKEASRYVLDAFNNTGSDELAILSPTTLLRLERKRNWFLERLLKLGQVSILRDYSCHSNCDDPSRCARLVDEKWRSAFAAAFRFGTPQPSIIYRSLRSLEPSLSSPALHLPYTSCQAHARLWVADLFDRMFGLLITPARNWPSLALGGAALSPSTSASGGNGGGGGGGGGGSGWARAVGDSASSQRNAAKYFLWVEMRDEAPAAAARGRVGSA
ncbi:hypothetical protein JCM3770_007463 [Rhodotorula araucariae]